MKKLNLNMIDLYYEILSTGVSNVQSPTVIWLNVSTKRTKSFHRSIADRFLMSAAHGVKSYAYVRDGSKGTNR